MKFYCNDDLMGLLFDPEPRVRMVALNLLSEGYATHPGIFGAVVDGWDKLGPEKAFHEFPMLSYLPVPSDRVAESCERAAKMVERRALTDTETRCAGKLIEQVVTLPARELESHLSLIESTSRKSKIFFRVDVPGLQHRIELMPKAADELAQLLEQSIAALVENVNDPRSVHTALHTLEALRRYHPEYLDLSAVLSQTPVDSGPQAISFQITLQSLVQFEQVGLEHQLMQHLHDPRESVYATVVEALVRTGTPDAGMALVSQFESADDENQKWIARGLQRIRVEGLASKIAELRALIFEPHLWLMLLIAEVRQFDLESHSRICIELSRLNFFSETLLDSLQMYARLHVDDSPEPDQFRKAIVDYLQRSNDNLRKDLSHSRKKLQRSRHRTLAQNKKAIVQYRKKK